MTKPLIGPRAWSASAVKRFLSCPMAFKFQYVDKVPRPNSEIPFHWRLGTIVHAALEDVANNIKRTRSHGPWLTDENWNIAKAAIAREWAKEEMPHQDHPDVEGMWDRAHAMVQATLEDQSIPWEQIVQPEQKIYLTGDGLAAIGFIDLFLRPEDDTAHIRDYKTTSKAKRPDELERDKQLRLYAAMVRKKFPWARRVLVSHYYPPIAKEVTVEISMESGDEAYNELLAVKDMVQRETEWPTNKGSECTYCAYQEMCPAWVEQPDPEMIDLKKTVNAF